MRRYVRLTVPQVARVVELAGLGISDAAVARVVNHDLGLDIGPEQVRHHRRGAGLCRSDQAGGRVRTARAVVA